jgi:hypothetical protein
MVHTRVPRSPPGLACWPAIGAHVSQSPRQLQASQGCITDSHACMVTQCTGPTSKTSVCQLVWFTSVTATRTALRAGACPATRGLQLGLHWAALLRAAALRVEARDMAMSACVWRSRDEAP